MLLVNTCQHVVRHRASPAQTAPKPVRPRGLQAAHHRVFLVRITRFVPDLFYLLLFLFYFFEKNITKEIPGMTFLPVSPFAFSVGIVWGCCEISVT